MLDSFYFARLLDQKSEKTITMKITTLREAVLSIFSVQFVLLLIATGRQINFFCLS